MNKTEIDTLVFSGAGFNLPYEVGVCLELFKLVIPKKIIGTSAGAMVGLLFSICLHTDRDIEQFVNEMVESLDNQKVYDGSFISVLYRFFYHNYLFETDVRMKILDMCLSEIGVDSTFNDLPVDLTMVSVNYDTGETVLLNKSNTPHLKLKEAALLSSSLPGIFKEIYIDSNLILNQEFIGEIRLVDGGFKHNYPISLVENPTNSLGVLMTTPFKTAEKGLLGLAFQIIQLSLLASFNLDMIPDEWIDRTIFCEVSNFTENILQTVYHKEELQKCIDIGRSFVIDLYE